MTNIRTDLKILVIGCSGTGKTSFVQRWTKGEFDETHKPTIVSEFGFKIYESKGQFYRIQLWDIGGQDKSPSMAKIFSRDSHGCVVVSDATNKETLKETINWKKIVCEESTFIDGRRLPFILVQNKVDLLKSKEDVDQVENDTKNICYQEEFTKYFLTSVKENVNVDESMVFLLDNIIDRLEKYAEENGGKDVFNDPRRKDTIKIKSGGNSKNKHDCC